MSIRVTCPKCHTRFNVSEKFAGKEGPCPKCKGVIKIPALDEQVVIHAPDTSGPKDSKGRSILKPLRRSDTVLSGVQITLIAACIIGFLAAALVVRLMMSADVRQISYWMLGIAALVIAPPLCYVGYHLLRNQEMGIYPVSETRARVAICSVIYVALWALFPLACYAFNNDYSLGSWLTASIAMLGIGGVAGMYSFDLDYILGLVHYGMYFAIGLIGRAIAGLGFLPSNTGIRRVRTTTMLESGPDWVSSLMDVNTWFLFM